jgi:hypothetical protein
MILPAVLLLLLPRRGVVFAGMTAGLLAGAAVVRTGGEVLHRERTFFGTHEVTSIQGDAWHVLTHGTTTHGVQATDGRRRSLPTAYYHPAGPLGDVVFALAGRNQFRTAAGVGLGAGALAAYAGSGVRLDVFEIDPAVIRIAESPRFFTYLADARQRPGVEIRTILSDGRRGLQAASPGSYDLIVIDAFSSDAIPTHLLTVEALSLYVSRLTPGGIVAFHVSSRFFDLPPVIARLAADQGFVCYVRDDRIIPPERAAEAMRPSVWAVVARTVDDLGPLAAAAPRWMPVTANLEARAWSDEYANTFGALVGMW